MNGTPRDDRGDSQALSDAGGLLLQRIVALLRTARKLMDGVVFG